MKSRLVASLAISAAVIVGATGCSMISPVATQIQYSASDGVNVPGDGPVLVRNALIVANEDGTVGNFVAALVNDTQETASITIEVEGLAPATVKVKPGNPVSLGAGAEPLLLEGLDAMPGTTIAVYFQTGDAEGQLVQVPVLDGSLAQYADLVPSE